MNEPISQPEENADSALLLLVDDNPMNLDMLDTILKVGGYRTATYLRSSEALEDLKQLQPDLILLDISMPIMDGFEFCERAKADEATLHIPVIFISALDTAEDKVRGFQVGGADYITKPFQMEEVLARVENQLTMQRQKAELIHHLTQIEHLQGILRSFLSTSAWESLKTDFLISDSGYEPEYEVMTIMMTDVEGFTKLSESLEPDDLIATLSLYMNMLSRIVYQHNGEVDKFMGDGMFAFFRDANDALAAAQRIMARVHMFNRQQESRGGTPMPTRIGLATGRVLLALIGSSSRREYTLIGDRVNVASRLQGLAPVGLIALDERTYVTAGRPDYHSLAQMPMKGKASEEPVYFIKPDPNTSTATLEIPRVEL